MYSLDNFLVDPMGLREAVLTHGFADTVNPMDGVVYPNICPELPESSVLDLQGKLTALFGKCEFYQPFARLSLVGVKAPHAAHPDTVMGTHTLLLSLTLDKDLPEGAGTSLVTHKETGLWWDNQTPEEFEVWERDTNNWDAWRIDELMPMRLNTANIAPARRYHRAEPKGGFGTTPENGRIMLIQFFSPECL